MYYILEVSFSWLKYCISKAPLPDLSISRERVDQFIDHFPLRATRRVGLSGEEVSEGWRDLKGEGEYLLLEIREGKAGLVRNSTGNSCHFLTGGKDSNSGKAPSLDWREWFSMLF